MPPPGYKKIAYSFVYHIMFDLKRKARIVAGGHMTESPMESCYSGVVPINAARLAMFLSVLISMKACASDVGTPSYMGRLMRSTT